MLHEKGNSIWQLKHQIRATVIVHSIMKYSTIQAIKRSDYLHIRWLFFTY